jgi:hypothetical protein
VLAIAVGSTDWNKGDAPTHDAAGTVIAVGQRADVGAAPVVADLRQVRGGIVGVGRNDAVGRRERGAPVGSVVPERNGWRCPA